MPETPEGRELRLARYRHNGLLGNVGIMKVYLKMILRTPTITPEAAATGSEIENLLTLLSEQLKTRIDP